MNNITKHYNIKQAGGLKWREIKNTIKYSTKNKRFHD